MNRAHVITVSDGVSAGTREDASGPALHNLLHPFHPIEGGDDEQLFTVRDLMRMKKVDRS